MKPLFIKVANVFVIVFMMDTILVVGFREIVVLVVVAYRLTMEVMFWFVTIAFSAEALAGFHWTDSTGIPSTVLLISFISKSGS